MPNLTISVPEDLKGEMDKLSEVNWSEVCRNAISQYITQRRIPTPQLELSLRNATINDYDYTTGYPSVRLSLRIHNKMNSKITIDRILCEASFIDMGKVHAVGIAYDLHKRNIEPNQTSGAIIILTLFREKILELKDVFKSTFTLNGDCTLYVEGFRDEYREEIKTNIPIDQWNSIVKKALKTDQATQE